MSNLVTLNLWFNTYPGPLQPAFRYALAALVILFVAGTAGTWYIHAQNKKNLSAHIWLSAYNFCLTGTIIGALLFFFTYEQVRLLSARFWFVLWALLHVIWAYYIYTKWKRLPEIQKTIDARKEYRKYIP